MKIAKIKFERLDRGIDWIRIWRPELFDKSEAPAKSGPIDLRLGPLFGRPCQTCGSRKCSGHDGYIELPTRGGTGVIHPLYGDVMKFIPVIPLPSRKIATLDGNVMFDDTTLVYVTILNILEKYNKLEPEDIPLPIWEDFMRTLQYYIDLLVENKHGKIARGSNRLLKGSLDRLKGKYGLVRRSCLGKKTYNMARAVFSPDPELAIDEVGVPQAFVNVLTTQEQYDDIKAKDPKFGYVIHVPTNRWFIANHFVMAENNNKFEYRLVRPIENGDIVMVNRAPSLHRMNILAFWVSIRNTNTISLNPQVLACFNCDADGDAINIIVPSSEAAKKECKRTMLASKNIVSPRNGKNIIGPQQDYKLYCWFHNIPEPTTPEGMNALTIKVANDTRMMGATFDENWMRTITTRVGSRGNPEQYKQMFQHGLQHEITKVPNTEDVSKEPRPSYMEGLTPGHFWEAASEGRMSMVTKSIGPAKSGYMQRILIFAAGDLIWNGSEVIDSYGKVVSKIDFSDFPVNTNIGIIMAQSFGELSTQTILRSFHKPGEHDVSGFDVLSKLLLRYTKMKKEELNEKIKEVLIEMHLPLNDRWVELLTDLKWQSGSEEPLSWAFVMKHKSPLHSMGFERIKQNLKTIIGKEDQLISPFAKVIVGQYQ